MGRLIDTSNIRVKPQYMQDVMGIAMIRCEDLSRILADAPIVEAIPREYIEQILAKIHKNAATLREHGYDSVAIDAFEILVENIIHEYTKEQVDNTRPYYANEWL